MSAFVVLRLEGRKEAMAWETTLHLEGIRFIVSHTRQDGEHGGLFFRDPETIAAIKAKDPRILDGLAKILDEIDSISATMRFADWFYPDDPEGELEEERDANLILQSTFFATLDDKNIARLVLKRIENERQERTKKQAEKEAKRIHLAKRRSEFQNKQAQLTLALINRDGYQCKECGSQEDLTIDHVFPLSKGGGDDLDNLQFLCRSHNSKKGDADT